MITEINPNGIHEWVASVKKNRTALPMNDAQILTRLMMMEMMNPLPDPKMIKECDEMTHLRKMAVERTNWIYQFRLSPYLGILLALLFRNPGNIVMVMAVMQDYVFEHPELKGKDLSISDFCKVFPMGYPTEDEWSKLWDAQKISIEGTPTDNMMDCGAFYKSIILD